jgi:hypothetical protein
LLHYRYEDDDELVDWTQVDGLLTMSRDNKERVLWANRLHSLLADAIEMIDTMGEAEQWGALVTDLVGGDAARRFRQAAEDLRSELPDIQRRYRPGPSFSDLLRAGAGTSAPGSS